jgi:hypothetical protein
LRRVTAEPERIDVGTYVFSQTLQVAYGSSTFLSDLDRLICPERDQDSEGDDGEFAER